MQLFSFGICLKVVWTHFPKHGSGKALIFWPGRRCGWHRDFWFCSHAARLTSSLPYVFDLLRRKANTWCRSRRHGFLSARRVWKVGSRDSLAPLSLLLLYIYFFFFQDTVWRICAADLLRNDRPVLRRCLPGDASIFRFLNWQSLCLGDVCKTNGLWQTALEAHRRHHSAPRWSAITSATIWQFIWAAPPQMMSVLVGHNLRILL